MGSLGGHVLPGTFFLAFAIWWIYSILKKYYRSRIARQQTYHNTSSFPISVRGGEFPVEGILKIAAAGIGITGETLTAFQNGHFAHIGNAHHISMFFFFGLNGAVDLLYFFNYTLPPNLDYATAVLAFVVEGLLFANHLHGRTMMDVQVHMFLLYIVVGCVVATLMEARYRSSVVPALARSYFTFLQGTWFYQVGFILYPFEAMSKWQEDNHEQMMLVTTVLSWHFALGIAFILFVNFLVAYLVKREFPSESEYQRISMNLLSKDSAKLINSGGIDNKIVKDFAEISEEEA